MPFLLSLVLLPFTHRIKHLLFVNIVFVMSFLLVISPWVIRNYVVLDDFIPVATGGGIVVLMGSQEEYLTIPGKPEMLKKYPPPNGRKPSEIDKYWRNAGINEHIRHLTSDPVGFLEFTTVKFLRLWYATESGYNHVWTLGGNLPIYVLACIGLIIVFRRKQVLVLLPLFVVGYYVLLHWASLPLFRYMMPVMPHVIGLASFAALELTNQWRLLERFLKTVTSGPSKFQTLDSHPER